MNYNSIQKSEAASFVSSKKSSLLHGLTSAIYVLVALAAIANLIGTNTLATQGIVLDNLMSKTQKLGEINRQMRQEISKSTNLSYIESEAVKLGFKKIKSSLSISAPQAVAAVFPKD